MEVSQEGPISASRPECDGDVPNGESCYLSASHRADHHSFGGSMRLFLSISGFSAMQVRTVRCAHPHFVILDVRQPSWTQIKAFSIAPKSVPKPTVA
jgi:hypothetical protein